MNGDIAALYDALQSSPDSVERLIALGNALLAARRPTDALPLFEKAVTLHARDGSAFRGLAQAQLDLDMPDLALASFRKASSIISYDRYAAYMVAALSGTTGEKAGAYVADLFDAYAPTFDQHLTGPLQYRIPQVISELVASDGKSHRIGTALDLGCGTGLVATALAGMVSAIDGIDISEQMTRRAAELDLYRMLRTGDFVSAMEKSTDFDGPYDLVIAADVFVYVGRLEQVFAATAKRLSQDGKFVFSVEDCRGENPKVRSSGRYAHPQTYVQRIAAQFNLVVIDRRPLTIRQERDMPIPGALYCLTRS